MEQQWAGTTYGNGWMHRWLIRMLRVMDVRILYAFVAVFVIPVCLILNPSRRTAYYYFRHRRKYGRLKSAWKTYTNHCIFGTVVIDRFAMYAGKKFKIDAVGKERFDELTQQPDGFLMFSSHIGNYEIAGYTFYTESKSINALVFDGEKASVMSGREKMFSDKNIFMIPIKSDMSHLFLIDKALHDGEIVSMPADRINGSPKYIELDFLGAKAKFSQGAFSVATMRGLAVLAVNVMKTSLTGYTAYVTELEYDKSASRKEQISQLSKAYVRELERILDMYPAQWYNFFDFWN